jgi:hypothetical protein
MDIKTISPENRQLINNFISSQWFTTNMVIRGKILYMTMIPLLD